MRAGAAGPLLFRQPDRKSSAPLLHNPPVQTALTTSMLYDRSKRELIKDMVRDFKLQPGEVFTTARAIQWFYEHYPKFKPGSVRVQLVQSATNDRGRLSHSSTDATDDHFFKLAPGQFRLYEPGKDPAPIHEFITGDIARQEEAQEEERQDELMDPPQGSSQFALEQDLQRYLADNLHIVEPGLKLFEDEGMRGLEYPAGGGRRIDILAVDRVGGLVVLELKVEKGYDRVVGQLLRYMGWVRRELADPGQRIRGVIVCRKLSDDLRLACAGLPNVELFEYQLSVTVKRAPDMT